MGLQLQNAITKLPRSLLFLEGSCFRGTFKLSSALSANRTYSCPSRSKDFRFPLPANAACANFSPAGCPLVLIKYPNATTKHGMIVCHRYASTDNKQASDQKKSLVEAKESPYAHLTTGQKVKEVGKDASYTLVILVGIAVTGFIFYVIGRELLSSQSPSGVYGEALTKCQKSIEVTAALGEPIKGYGETTRRGRRRHVSHTEFEVNGVPHMRLRFYIEGPYKKGTVHVEVQKGDSGKFEYRYLVVETEGYPQRTFVLEDNR